MHRVFGEPIYVYRRFPIRWLKNLASLAKRSGVMEIASVTNTTGEIVPHSFVKASLYMIYLALEYFFGRYFVMRHKSNGRLIVFDRYFYDYMVFRDFQKTPRWLLSILARAIPSPDICFYPKADVSVLYARKREYSPAELERQVTAIESVKRLFHNLVEVDNSRDFQDVVRDIENIILKRLIGGVEWAK